MSKEIVKQEKKLAEDKDLLTIEEHSVIEGHVNVAPGRGERPNPVLQKKWVYDCAKIHAGFGIGHKCTRDEYLQAVDAALNVGVG